MNLPLLKTKNLLPETELRVGAVYRHYKGNFYQVVGLGRHTENHTELVAYVPLDGVNITHRMWFRPRAMFVGRTADGMARFELAAKDFHTWKLEAKKQGRVVTKGSSSPKSP